MEKKDQNGTACNAGVEEAGEEGAGDIEEVVEKMYQHDRQLKESQVCIGNYHQCQEAVPVKALLHIVHQVVIDELLQGAQLVEHYEYHYHSQI